MKDFKPSHQVTVTFPFNIDTDLVELNFKFISIQLQYLLQFMITVKYHEQTMSHDMSHNIKSDNFKKAQSAR